MKLVKPGRMAVVVRRIHCVRGVQAHDRRARRGVSITRRSILLCTHQVVGQAIRRLARVRVICEYCTGNGLLLSVRFERAPERHREGIEAIASAQHGSPVAEGLPGNAEARLKDVVVVVDELLRQSCLLISLELGSVVLVVVDDRLRRVALRDDLRDRRVQHHGVVLEVEARHQPILLPHRRMRFVAKAEIQSQALGHMVVVLDVAVELHVVVVLVRRLLVDAVDNFRRR